MISDRLSVELDKVASRYQQLWSRQAYAAATLVCSVVAVLCAYFGLRDMLMRWGGLAIISTLPLLAVYVLLRSRFLIANRTWVAHKIESKFPDLNSCLLTAVEQYPSLESGRLGFLQASVITEAVNHAESHDWTRVVSARRMRLSVLANVAAYLLFICAISYSIVPCTAALRDTTCQAVHRNCTDQQHDLGSACHTLPLAP